MELPTPRVSDIAGQSVLVLRFDGCLGLTPRNADQTADNNTDDYTDACDGR